MLNQIWRATIEQGEGMVGTETVMQDRKVTRRDCAAKFQQIEFGRA